MNPVFAEFDYCVFDLETTGLDPEDHVPIEVGAVRIEDGEVVEDFESFVDPGRAIPAEVRELTGIRDGDVTGADPPAAVLGQFLEFAEGDILVAHNIDFDHGFLRAYAPAPVEAETIDTLRMARKLLPVTSHSLDSLAAEYGLEREEGHRARADAAATAQLFDDLTERVSSYDDYRRCGIPEVVRRNDLDLVLGALSEPNPFTAETGPDTVRELTESNEGTLAEAVNRSPEVIRRLQDSVRRVATDESIDLRPPVTLTNCFRVRYWSAANVFWNVVGGVVIALALFTNRVAVFRSRIWLGVAFLLISPVVTYFRRTRYARLLQWLTGVIPFSLWLSLGYYLDLFSPRTLIAAAGL